MIGFEVSLNSNRLCVAGVGESGVLTAAVSCVFRSAPGVASPTDLSLKVGGMSGDLFMDWPVPRKLQVGDEIVVRIVSTERPDQPSRTERDDRAVVEADERMQYERLKAKYERR